MQEAKWNPKYVVRGDGLYLQGKETTSESMPTAIHKDFLKGVGM